MSAIGHRGFASPQRIAVAPAQARIAVLIPCHNEEAAIAGVIAGFRASLPAAAIYVYDNNSTDRTVEIAKAAGAAVKRERHQGKGHVVRRMFADVDADIYVLVDGDMTYDAHSAGRLVDVLVEGHFDMVVARRVAADGRPFPRGHQFGNSLFNQIVTRLFGAGFTDILSGYRVMSRRFVKSFPAHSTGFETETEFSVHALDLKLATAEVPLAYGERPGNSVSKLRTFRDGWRILVMILMMYRAVKPFQFYGLIGTTLVAFAVLLAAPLAVTYAETGLVPRLPTAILATGLVQIGFISIACGIIVEAISAGRREAKRMRYLDLPAPGFD